MISGLVVAAISALLESDDLRRHPWRGDPNPVAGHCYVASEALFHLFGGKEAGWKSERVRVAGVLHWFLRDADGVVLDVTASQFSDRVPYETGRGCGFLTKQPSRRARKLMRRIADKIEKIDRIPSRPLVGVGVVGVEPDEAIKARKNKSDPRLLARSRERKRGNQP